MEIIQIIIACFIASLGFIAGKIIQIAAKDEAKQGIKIIKKIKEIIYGLILVFLFIVFDINIIISIFLATAITTLFLLRPKKEGKIRLLIIAITLASAFKTKFFLITAGIIFFHNLLSGITEKRWIDTIKKTALLLLLSLVLIYLRTI